ncbi:ferritin heavy chain-like [Sorex araneus]|uniref:ferritin heavy chain-like n=1 Tax=Sorex araneus TaxID=42254 RepID=UPI0024338BEA|nr:ferritin heavy chain-like [Sorex araneus]
MSGVLPVPLSSVYQSLAADCEDAINTQINLELCTAYVYLSMSYYFDREDVGLKRFSRYFRELFRELFEQAEKLMQLQNQRGAQLCFYDVQKPHKDGWEDGLNAMDFALILLKLINDGLHDLYKLATDMQDGSLCSYLENHVLPQQDQCLKELADHVSTLRNMVAPEEYLFGNKTGLDGDGDKKD